ncbi:Tetraacyldisaccharide 4'-kinase [Polaribacter huanghezhanensis]|uniref:tetraacyldisaccharide 4'-kinase n=1 Tax=Polaribacter huanghezhanensis TaxID=1354726 RepID=UPI002648AB43|nr:tetraacyldisaccharide 4'-kinase [Polaribacter huanghezhanensis]WKD84753.1 Tetraacyldisaccharide 4'-kinase [Polaribacter huanghezhanensis]
MKFIRFLLFPFAIIYSIVTTIRNYFFDVGVFKSTRFEKPIIAVGNLSVGGTGKTPQIEYLIQLLKSNYKMGVLSRGYGRKTNGFILVDEAKNALEVGDEPLQFSKKFKDITVAVDENRVHGIEQLKNTDVLLLDDAFQHRKVKAGFYVLLTKYNELFSNDFVLPTGNLRERRIGAKRADVVVVTKCPTTIDALEKQELQQLIRRYFKGPIFFSSIQYADVLLSNNNTEIKTSDLNLYEVLLVTGIANPKPLEEHLSALNCRFKHVNFSDHHQFTEKEITDLKEKFTALKSENKMILTTEKDFVRLSNQLENLYYLPIQTSFLDDQEKFDSLITNYVEESL